MCNHLRNLRLKSTLSYVLPLNSAIGYLILSLLSVWSVICHITVVLNMDEVHRKVLQRNRPYLMKEVLLETLWPHLVAREVFTDEMIEHIQVFIYYLSTSIV